MHVNECAHINRMTKVSVHVLIIHCTWSCANVKLGLTSN